PHLVGAQALDAPQLAGRVVDDPLADRRAVGGDLYGVAGLELALHLGDADRQQAAAALAQDAGRAVVDPQRPVTWLRIAEPELEARGTLRMGGEASAGLIAGRHPDQRSL